MFHDKADEHDKVGGSENYVRSAEPAFARKECYNCHAEHGAVDNVFTQFYSVLTTARQKQVDKEAAAK